MKKFSSVIKNLHLLRKEWYGIIVKKARSHFSHSFSTFLSSRSVSLQLGGRLIYIMKKSQEEGQCIAFFLTAFSDLAGTLSRYALALPQ